MNLRNHFDKDKFHVLAQGMVGSSVAMAVTALFDEKGKQQHLVVLPDKELAAYFFNDVEGLLDESDFELIKKGIVLPNIL